MSDLKILGELISDQSQLDMVDTQSKGYAVSLEETGHNPGYSLRISNIPGECLAFKADSFPSTNKFFKGNKGECKRADFILIVRTDSSNWIVCIEMKYGNSGGAKVIQQLKGAACLIEYCRAVGSVFWESPDFLKEQDYQLRFVSIRNIRLNKQPTRTLPKSDTHDKPEEPLHLNAPGSRLQFMRLVSRHT